MKGIYMIFEIFLRPILIIFGLLAAFIIFSALVKVLNEIFSLVVVNLAGHHGGVTAQVSEGPGFRVEPQIGLPLGLIGPVAGEAVACQDGPDIAGEVNRRLDRMCTDCQCENAWQDQ